MNKNNNLNQEEIARYTRRFWKVWIAIILFVILLLLGIGLGLFGSLPSFRDLENPKSNLASEVYAEDGVPLGAYYIQNRSNVRYNQVSPYVIQALIATEDVRFYTHSGIDLRRTFAILFYNLIGKRQGASTITQQLALNLFSKEGRSRTVLKRIIQKLQEWIIAVKLEKNYTKEEIITMYLNTVDFGSYNNFGIKAAARTYFNTTPDKLKPEEAAVIIGMLKGPSLYSPVRNPKGSLIRRNVVLASMYKAGFLTEAQKDSLQSLPLHLTFRPSTYSEGPAAYFRAVLKRDIQKTFDEQSITKGDGTPYDLDRDGLKIYTTINSRMQLNAEMAQKEYLKTLQEKFNQQWYGRDPFKGAEMRDLLDQGVRRSDRYRQLKFDGKSDEEIASDFNTPTKMTIFSWHGDIDTIMRPIDSVKYSKLVLRNAILSMEPRTGYIRAWVGGPDFKHFKYDQVKMGARQVGSTAKPFTYAVAIENYGFSPCYKVLNQPVTIVEGGQSWTPKDTKPIPGYITLRQGLARSQNYVTAWVMKQVGAEAVRSLIKKMGITTEVPSYPSICLGTFDATLYDMVGAYSVFVNQGVWTEPIYLLRIEDRHGNVLYQRRPKVAEVLNPQTAYVMVDMLKSAVTEGTGAKLRYKYGFTYPMGGKTGTTQRNSDGWFIGITPQLVTGVWTGCEDRALHFFSWLGAGGNSALPVFALYMKSVYLDPTLKYNKNDFDLPKGGLDIILDCGAYSGKTDSAKAAKL